MRKTTAAIGAISALTILPTTAALAQDTEPLETAPEVAQAETDTGDGDSDDWGLLGLVGLVGLAGLKRRDSEDDRSRSTASSGAVR